MLSTEKVEDNTVEPICFNNCSGRGRCVDYACECDVGYDGDDCSFCEWSHAINRRIRARSKGFNQPIVFCRVLPAWYCCFACAVFFGSSLLIYIAPFSLQNMSLVIS